MSMVWNDMYDDEEKLRGLSGLEIRYLYLEAPKEKRALIAKVAAEKLVNLDEKDTVYDTLNRLNLVVEHNGNPENEQVSVEYDKVFQSSKKLFDKLNSKDVSELAECMDLKALTSILRISADKISSKLNDDELDNIRKVDDVVTKKVEKALINTDEISPETEEAFYNANNSGALNDVDDSAKKVFVQNILTQTGWGNATGKSIIDADKMLADNVDSVELYIEKNGEKKLNWPFLDCYEAAKNIQFEIAEGTDPETAQRYKDLYIEQLMANALQRATQDVLRNPKLLGESNKKEEIRDAFKNLVSFNFERSVIVAGLATSPNTTNGITIDKNTGKAEYVYTDATANEIKEIFKGTRKISPLAVNLDTHQLGIETSRTEAALKLNKVDKSQVPFWNKVKKVVGTAYNKIIKEGGWKKIALNATMFMGAAAMTASGAAGLILAGASVYAGWTAANAWIAPAWDKLSAEIRQKKITGLKNKLAYRLNNLKRAMQEKCAEPGFKQRAVWRTVEGVAVGGVTAALGIGGAGGWLKSLVRQGTMIAGKAASLTKSWFNKKTAAEKMAEQYSVANYKALQTAEGYLKQDKIALTAVVGGSLLGDAVKLHAEGSLDASVIDEKISEISAKIKENLGENNEVGTEGNVSVESQATATNGEEATATNGEEATATNGEEATANQAGGNINIGEQSEGYASVTIGDETVKIKLVDADRLEELKTNTANKFKYNGELQRLIDNQKEVLKHYKDAGNISNTANINDGTVENFYDAINSGKVTTIPQGMSATEYVDRMARLIQYHAHKKACVIMLKDMLCDEFIPSDGDKLLVAKALNDIEYVKADMQYVKLDLDGNVIYDDNGNPCIGTTSRWGQYVGNQKYETITRTDGTTIQLPRRYDTVTNSIGANNDCEPKVGTSYNVNEPDCGCDDPEIHTEPEIKPEPKVEPRKDIEPPQPVQEDISGSNLYINAEKDVVAPKEEVEVNMQDPTAKGTAIKSSKGSYYDIDVESINGQAKRFAKGAVYVWDKDGFVVTEEGFEGTRVNGGVEAKLYAPSDVTQVVNKLPEAPTDVVKGDDGSITYLYEFGKGKNISVVLDAPKEGETERVGHFFIGKDEIVIDKESAEALMSKMTEKTNMKFISTDGDEQSVMDRIEVKERIQKRIDNYYTRRAENMENPVLPDENADFMTRQVTSQSVDLTAEQKAQIMSKDTQMTCIGIKDGKAILEVEGVEGVDRIAVAAPTHVDYDLSQNQPVATVGENGQYTVTITTADEKEMLVNIANGKATTILDGKPVVLDTESCKSTENMVKMALRQKNVNMNIDLHTDFTEKVVKAVEQAEKAGEGTTVSSYSRSVTLTSGKTANGQTITTITRNSSASIAG